VEHKVAAKSARPYPAGDLAQLLLEAVQRGNRLTRRQLEPQQLVVALLDALQILLVLDLELIKVDDVQHLAGGSLRRMFRPTLDRR
jgi:hypothetical protein